MRRHDIAGNPYALLTNDVVTELVFMAERSPKEIKEELSKYTYDECISLVELGKDVFVGYVKYEGKYVPPRPFKKWVLNEFEIWAPPVPRPTPVPNKFWNWDDETCSWVIGDKCQECDSHHN